MANFTTTQTGEWDDGPTWGSANSPGTKGLDWPGDADNATIEHDVNADISQTRNGDTTINSATLTIVGQVDTGTGSWTDDGGGLIVVTEGEYPGAFGAQFDVTIPSPIRVDAGGTLEVLDGHTLTATNTVTLNGGTLYIMTDTDVINCSKPIVCTADSTIDWVDADGEIQGGFDAAGHAVTHSNATGAPTLQLDVGDGSTQFDLGTGSWSAVQVNAVAGCDQVLQDDINVKGLDLAAGAFDMNSKIVDAHGGTTQCVTACTLANAGTIKISAATTDFKWYPIANTLGLLDIDADTSFGNDVYTFNLDVAAGVTITGNDKLLAVRPTSGDGWKQKGTITGLAALTFYGHSLSADATITDAVDVGTAPIALTYRTNGHRLTLAGGLVSGTLTINGSSNVFIATISGPYDIQGDLLFDQDDDALTLSGDGTITGDIKRNAAETGNSLDLAGGTLDLGGTFDGTGIAVSHDGAQVQGGTIQNFSLSNQTNQLRCRGVTEGASVTARSLLHLNKRKRFRFRSRPTSARRVA